MSALWWWTAGLGAAAVLLAVYTVRAWEYDDPIAAPLACAALLLAVGMMWAAHWINESAYGSEPGPTPARQCVVKQLQDVWVGKFYEKEWACTGWAQ